LRSSETYCGISPRRIDTDILTRSIGSRMTRRSMFTLGGTALAGAAFNAAQPELAVQSQGAKKRVIVVGAGIAGLSCAYELIRRGMMQSCWKRVAARRPRPDATRWARRRSLCRPWCRTLLLPRLYGILAIPQGVFANSDPVPATGQHGAVPKWRTAY
jgi:hypothetical protein